MSVDSFFKVFFYRGSRKMGNGWREYEVKKGFLDGSYESNLFGVVGLWGCGNVVVER